jgi:hypothetical protein
MHDNPQHQSAHPAPKMPENLRLIRLRLAREKGHPEGDPQHGYDILAPLSEDGRIDAAACHDHHGVTRVRRFRPAEEDAIGRLVHGPGGAWLIAYEGQPVAHIERGFHFRDERFTPGEYVSIREDDGQMHTFRVWEVRRP